MYGTDSPSERTQQTEMAESGQSEEQYFTSTSADESMPPDESMPRDKSISPDRNVSPQDSFSCDKNDGSDSEARTEKVDSSSEDCPAAAMSFIPPVEVDDADGLMQLNKDLLELLDLEVCACLPIVGGAQPLWLIQGYYNNQCLVN